jgi:hypothetical protein
MWVELLLYVRKQNQKIVKPAISANRAPMTVNSHALDYPVVMYLQHHTEVNLDAIEQKL